ncbi:HepT-like ribonuclease domain-containing protein [Marinoscillum pacificum]|uniref:HepT-like ribonuclease domain-containing protein n=1 Tax=Marinoscillum pacificum TaxID=392723 RepID=UPI002157CF3C|nr:DUF86 domain-containing protein [Marinoscillum pacificum]
MSKRDNQLLILDMLEAANRVNSYTQNYSYQEFIEDQKTLDAVVRNFEIIGEASSRVDTNFQTSNPQIPWSQLKGYRNRLIHEYFGVDYDIVWEIISDDLDLLIDQLEALKDN